MNKIFGYCRVSTKVQSLERQEKNIYNFNKEAIIFGEDFTGTTQDRPEWKKLKQLIRKGDTIIFDSVSRMSRNSENGVKEYVELFEEGINLIFLRERHIDTEVFNKALSVSIPHTDNEIITPILEGVKKALQIKAKLDIEIAFDQAEKERNDIVERTKQGQLLSKKKTGRKKRVINDKVRDFLNKNYFESRLYKNKELIESLNISERTFYNYITQIKEEKREKREADLERLGLTNNLKIMEG